MFRPVRSILLALALAACDSPTESVTPIPGDPVVQRQVWEQQGIDDYRYRFNILTSSIQPVTQMRVDVRDGDVVDVVDARTGERLSPEMWSLVLTVDGVFDKLAAARASGEETRMEFHPRLGYPMVARTGRMDLDGGTVYAIFELRRLD
jgi:hypothetical protein